MLRTLDIGSAPRLDELYLRFYWISQRSKPSYFGLLSSRPRVNLRSRPKMAGGDGEVIVQIYKERVIKRGYGSGSRGWLTAYHEGIAV